MRTLLIAFALATCCLFAAQGQAAPAPIAARLAEVLTRSANGHSPTSQEIAAAGADLVFDSAAVQEARPLLAKALDNTDVPVRTFALTLLIGLESSPAAAENAPSAAAAADAGTANPTAVPVPPLIGPSSYRLDVQKALAPVIPQIAARLTDESQGNRILAAGVLGAFTPDPPAATYAPLLGYLKRDDAISQVGKAVVDDLLQFGPLSEEIANAIARFLRRSDQTADSRSDIIDAIASHSHQSQALNKAVLVYLDTDDPTVRARLILSLPQLDLAPQAFADTRSRVSQLAANSSENLQVINAAKAVTSCWTATKMTTGCPVY